MISFYLSQRGAHHETIEYRTIMNTASDILRFKNLGGICTELRKSRLYDIAFPNTKEKKKNLAKKLYV